MSAGLAVLIRNPKQQQQRQARLQRIDSNAAAKLNPDGNKPPSTRGVDLVGDVAGRDAILVDDMIDTAGTVVRAAQASQYCMHSFLTEYYY